MPTITPFFMFVDQLEAAIGLYTSVFPDSKVLSTSKDGEGNLKGAEFELAGQRFNGYNGGPHFSFSEGLSLFVSCRDQEEVDYYWSRLSQGGSESMCGWLKDPFGVSWQIIPTVLMEMLSDPDPEKSGRATQAMLQMQKIDISKLRAAFDG